MGWSTALWLAGVGCSDGPARLEGAGSGQSSESRENIVLVSIDTLRADHLGCYGYPRDTSPHLDRFAAGAIRYRNAFAPAPWTLPSHVAMLSGWHPYDAGIHEARDAIAPQVRLVSELLHDAGYRTAAFVDSPAGGYLGGERGFARGFEHYAHAPLAGQDPRTRYIYDMAVSVDVALDWLDEVRGSPSPSPSRPFFLFLHTMSVHSSPSGTSFVRHSDAPYDKPDSYRTRFLPEHQMRFRWGRPPMLGGAHLLFLNGMIAKGLFDAGSLPEEQIEELIGLYDGGIYYTDEHFGRLLAGLRERGLDGDTVVLVASDHGEAFLDYRYFLHKEVRPALLRVPLMIRDPRRGEAGVVEQRVELMDVAPTILALAGISPPAGLSGRVLPSGDRKDGGVAPEPRNLFSYYEYREVDSHAAFALDDGRFKLIVREERWPQQRKVVELYDVLADPLEKSPLAGYEQRRAALQARLERRLESGGGVRAEPMEISEGELEQLRALGYLE